MEDMNVSKRVGAATALATTIALALPAVSPAARGHDRYGDAPSRVATKLRAAERALARAQERAEDGEDARAVSSSSAVRKSFSGGTSAAVKRVGTTTGAASAAAVASSGDRVVDGAAALLDGASADVSDAGVTTLDAALDARDAVVAKFLSPTPASAVTVGLGDQKAAIFSDGRLRALGLRHARLIVPWNAATSEPQVVQQWLDATASAGMVPHVAFEHLRSDRCPSSPCVVPTRAQYRAAVTAFRQRFPSVTTFTTWNEANHQSQPVATRPEAVAGYYEELVSVCPSCTVVAGDVLDSGTYVRWLDRFQAATSTDPQLWGLHNYSDATYLTTEGTDAVLAAVPGQLWLEETGGIVTLRNAAGRETLTTNETRAAQGIDQAFAIAATRPRVTRMYVYHWQAKVLDRFDAGLARPDGSLRPSYTRLAANLAGTASAATTATAAAIPAPGWKVRRNPKNGRQLLLTVTCRATGRKCTGKVTLRIKGKTIRTRRYATTIARRTQTLKVTVPKASRTRLTKVTLRVTPTAPARAASTLARRVTR